MTEPRSKSEKLSETTKKAIIKAFARIKHNRIEEIDSKFLQKGNAREEDSITLLCRATKKFYKKNDVRIENEYQSGEPDLYEGQSIYKADETIDIKSSWSYITFLQACHEALNKDYEWQGHSYMGLTGAKKHTVAYCLVNGTDTHINDEKRKLSFKAGMIDYFGNATDKYKEKCKQIEINHIFNLEEFIKENPHFQFDNDITQWSYDIPMEERVFLRSFQRNDEKLEALYSRIEECRTWMKDNLFNQSLICKEA